MSNRRARRAEDGIQKRGGYSTSKPPPKLKSPPKGPAPGAKPSPGNKSK